MPRRFVVAIRCVRYFTAAIFLASTLPGATVRAEDPNIGQLLKKLPPPEKLAGSGAQRALASRDPALNDPLAKEAFAALDANKLSRALAAGRKLARKYSRNASAETLHGIVALRSQQLAEASTAFRTALSIQPSLTFAYFGLGLAEAFQGRYDSALRNFRELNRREPKAGVGWLAASSCAEKLGRRQESLDYAKRATVVAPAWAAAWTQLARAEKALGHNGNAQRATGRAKELTAAAAKSNKVKR